MHPLARRNLPLPSQVDHAKRRLVAACTAGVARFKPCLATEGDNLALSSISHAISDEISDLRIELRLFHMAPRVFGETRYKGQAIPNMQGTPVNVCRSRWLTLIFNMSRRRISVLGDVCEESTFCCVGAASMLHLHLLSSPLLAARHPRTHIYPFVQ